jgi:endonuclease/exonuclease/phosphatase family metal-dependent hydrolase
LPLKILTLNLWHDSGPWPERRALVRSWIERLDPDLIGFQELLEGPGFDQQQELVGDLGYETRFLRASRFWGNRELEFGNGVASRWPIRSRHDLLLPDAGDGETRSALSVLVDAPVPGGSLCFTSTHLNWKLDQGAVRERQVLALCDHVLDLSPPDGFPPIVVGDFNAEPDSSEVRFLQGLHSLDGRSVHFRDAWRVAGGEGPGTTWSNRNDYARQSFEPERRIDYVFSGSPMLGGSGLTETCRVVCDERVAGVWPSDHFGVYAELRLVAPSSS